jgi:hypothetical protein
VQRLVAAEPVRGSSVAPRSYRDDHGRPWLEALPPLIDLRVARERATALPDHLGRTGSFLSAASRSSGPHGPVRRQHGLRASNVCALEWAWEVVLPEVGRSVAVVRSVRIHDLRHTFGCRLRAAGVSAEDGAAWLGHVNQSMAGHYASADIDRLVHEANLVLSRQETRSVLRVANG